MELKNGGSACAEWEEDESINAFRHSAHGKRLQAAANEAVAQGADQVLFLDFGVDGVQLYKFKHHSSTVIVARVSNVNPERRGVRSNIDIVALVPGPHEPADASAFLEPTLRFLADSLSEAAEMQVCTPGENLCDTGGSDGGGDGGGGTGQAPPSRKRKLSALLSGVHADFPARKKVCGCGSHGHNFCCLWCMFQVRPPHHHHHTHNTNNTNNIQEALVLLSSRLGEALRHPL